MTNEYQVTIKIANSGATSGINEIFIPHAFVTISGPGLSRPVTIGYYPQTTGMSGPGTVKNDGYAHIIKDPITDEVIAYQTHPYDRSITFEVSGQQAMNGLLFAAKVANDPGTYQLFGAADKSNIVMADGYQCTGFARDMVRSMGIEGLDLYPKFGPGSVPLSLLSKYPGMLGPEFSFLAENQYQPYRGMPSADDFAAVTQQIYGGIKKFDPSDHTPASDVPAVKGSNTLVSDVSVPAGLGTSRDSAQYVNLATGVHGATLNEGGTLSDLWVLQKSATHGFANDKEFYVAVQASNPNITDVNHIPAGTVIYLPEKLTDGSVTYNYASGTSINSNAATGEYHMVVPNADGGQTIYSRTSDGDAGYVIKQVSTNGQGETTLDYTGYQASLDAEIKSSTADAFVYEDNQLVSQTRTQFVYDVNDQQTQIDITTDNTGTIRNVYDNDGNLFKSEVVSTGSSTLAYSVGATANFLILLRALQSGQPLPIATSGVNTLLALQAASGQSVSTSLAATGSALSALSSLAALKRSLDREDALGVLSSSAMVVSFSANAYVNLNKEEVMYEI